MTSAGMFINDTMAEEKDAGLRRKVSHAVGGGEEGEGSG